MTLIEVRSRSGQLLGRCDARCYEAVQPECECVCGGSNHGKGAIQAIRQTRELGTQMIPRQWRDAGQPEIPVLTWSEEEIVKRVERERRRFRHIKIMIKRLRGTQYMNPLPLLTGVD